MAKKKKQFPDLSKHDVLTPIDVSQLGTNGDPCFGIGYDLSTKECKPNYLVKQSDILASLCMEGSTDVLRMCNSLGVHVSRPEKLTFGQLLHKCNIL